MNNIPDLTGQRFGLYTVLGRAGSDRHGKALWLCRCDCGTEKTVTTGNLKARSSVNCGCKRLARLEGKRIGQLTVLERSDRYSTRGKRKRQLWKCLCDCGSLTYKATDVLNSGNVCMCQACSEQYGIRLARQNSGHQDGTQVTKIRNPSRESDNLSGIRGVYLDTKTGTYRARLKFRGVLYNLGTYTRLEDAVKARLAAEDDIFGKYLESLPPEE